MALSKDEFGFIQGRCTRNDGSVVIIRYVYEIENDKAMIGTESAPDLIEVNEPYSRMADWRQRGDVMCTERKPRGLVRK